MMVGPGIGVQGKLATGFGLPPVVSPKLVFPPDALLCVV